MLPSFSVVVGTINKVAVANKFESKDRPQDLSRAPTRTYRSDKRAELPEVITWP